jgi:hypothetical protein
MDSNIRIQWNSGVESSHIHSGSYNLIASATGTYAGLFAKKTLAFGNVSYCRGYVKFSGTLCPNNGDYVYLFGISQYDPNHKGTQAIVKNVNGSLFWGIVYWDATYASHVVLESVASNPQSDRWYCLEVMRDLTNNLQKLWVNDVLTLTVTDTLDAGAPTLLVAGVYQSKYVAAPIYFDDFVAGDSYIGCLPVSVSVTDTLGLSEDVLRHKSAIFLVDNVAVDDLMLNNKFLHVLDSIGAQDATLISKLLLTEDRLSIIETVEATNKTVRTRLFLILGDLAIQLIGN